MTALSGSRYALWIVLPLAAALFSSLAGKHVADTQRAIATAKRNIAADLTEIRRLRGELSARARPAMLEQVNEQSLGLAAPSADRYFHDVYALVGFAGDVDSRTAAAPAIAVASALTNGGMSLVHRTAFNDSFGAAVPLQRARAAAPVPVDDVALSGAGEAGEADARAMRIAHDGAATPMSRPSAGSLAVSKIGAPARAKERVEKAADAAPEAPASQRLPLIRTAERAAGVSAPQQTSLRLDAGALAAIRASVSVRP